MIEIKVQVKFSMKFIYPFLEFIPLRTIITMESRSNRNLVKLWGKYLRVKYKLLHSQLLSVGQISIDLGANAISFSAWGYNQRGIGVN